MNSVLCPFRIVVLMRRPVVVVALNKGKLSCVASLAVRSSAMSWLRSAVLFLLAYTEIARLLMATPAGRVNSPPSAERIGSRVVTRSRHATPFRLSRNWEYRASSPVGNLGDRDHTCWTV